MISITFASASLTQTVKFNGWLALRDDVSADALR